MRQCIDKIKAVTNFVVLNMISLAYIILLVLLLLIYLLNYFIPQYGWKVLIFITIVILIVICSIYSYLKPAGKRCEFCQEYFEAKKLLPVKNGHLSKSACPNCIKDTAPHRGYQQIIWRRKKDP